MSQVRWFTLFTAALLGISCDSAEPVAPVTTLEETPSPEALVPITCPDNAELVTSTGVEPDGVVFPLPDCRPPASQIGWASSPRYDEDYLLDVQPRDTIHWCQGADGKPVGQFAWIRPVKEGNLVFTAPPLSMADSENRNTSYEQTLRLERTTPRNDSVLLMTATTTSSRTRESNRYLNGSFQWVCDEQPDVFCPCGWVVGEMSRGHQKSEWLFLNDHTQPNELVTVDGHRITMDFPESNNDGMHGVLSTMPARWSAVFGKGGFEIFPADPTTGARVPADTPGSKWMLHNTAKGYVSPILAAGSNTNTTFLHVERTASRSDRGFVYVIRTDPTEPGRAVWHDVYANQSSVYSSTVAPEVRGPPVLYRQWLNQAVLTWVNRGGQVWHPASEPPATINMIELYFSPTNKRPRCRDSEYIAGNFDFTRGDTGNSVWSDFCRFGHTTPEEQTITTGYWFFTSYDVDYTDVEGATTAVVGIETTEDSVTIQTLYDEIVFREQADGTILFEKNEYNSECCGSAPRLHLAGSAPTPKGVIRRTDEVFEATVESSSPAPSAPTSPRTGTAPGQSARDHATTGLSDARGQAAHPQMASVSAGTYEVGCTRGQTHCKKDEKPKRQVTLLHSYDVMVHEVTQAEYAAVTGDNPSHFATCGDRCPVEMVSWRDAVTYANAVSRLAGLEECYDIDLRVVSWPRGVTCTGFRLPTEMEWEVAARGGADTPFSGGKNAALVGWTERNSASKTHPVMALSSNGYGLYDMTGNVQEWTWDWYGEDVYKAREATDPAGPASGSRRVVRGGDWLAPSSQATVAHRQTKAPRMFARDIGFRLVRTVP